MQSQSKRDVLSASSLPIAIIGAGPIGLAAAAHLLQRGEEPIIFESGSTVGSAIRAWGHVRLFTPWRYLVDQAASALLSTTSWQMPDADIHPTGHDLVDKYLIPLAQVPQIQARLHLHSQVTALTRAGYDKMKSPQRELAPFVLRVRTEDGDERDILARAVIDASGTYNSPNSLGVHGIAALGEHALRDHIFYGIPDVLGRHRGRYAGRRVLVVGSGHSAFNALLDLMKLQEEEPATRILWAIRRKQVGQLFGGQEQDALPERGLLGRRVRDLIEQERLRLVPGVAIEQLRSTERGISIVGEEERIGAVDTIIATTGFRPDLSLLGEMRLSLDPTVESPIALAPLIDPNLHSCGTVPPHGVDELSHPEQGLYIVGMKSYGRAPTFLVLTGYEQVRSIAAALVGDWESARQVQLELPETGVCTSNFDGSGDLEALTGGGGCCSTSKQEPTVVQVTRAVRTVPVQESCCG